nr:hypothetical protein [Acidimicrobiia bacterium]
VKLRARSTADAEAASHGLAIALGASFGRTDAVADAKGSVTATFGGDVLGSGGGAGATNLDVEAISGDTALARADAVAGGLFSGQKNDSDAEVDTDTVASIISGAVINLSGALKVVAEGATEADARTKGTGVGALTIGASESTVTVKPTIASFIAAGAQVSAGGSVEVTARSLPDLLPPPTYAIAAYNHATDRIQVLGHGLDTGDSVEYASNNPIANLVTTSDVGGQAVNRVYNVVNVITNGQADPNWLMFGSTFTAGACSSTAASCIDTTRDTVLFSTAHNLITGDRVVYEVGQGGSAAGGLTVTTVQYFVVVIDERTIRLSLTDPTASGWFRDVTNGQITGGNTFTTGSAHTFADGQAVTYYAPKAFEFGSGQVDVTAALRPAPNPDTLWQLDDTPGANNIVLVDADGRPVNHGLTTGERVIYNAQSYDSGAPVLISPLTVGGVYRVVKISDTSFGLKFNDKLTAEQVRFIRPASGGGGTVVRASGTWASAGFGVGQTVTITDAGLSNNGTFTVTAVDGGRLTLSGGSPFTGNLVEGVTALTGSGAQKDRLTRSGGWAGTTITNGTTISVNGTTFTVDTVSGDVVTLTATGLLAAGTVSVSTAAVAATFDGDLIALSPTKTVRGTPPSTPPVGHQAGSDVHSFLRVGDLPLLISGGTTRLVDGETYFVRTTADATKFQLATTAGGTALSFDLGDTRAAAVHRFSPGVNLTPGGAGEQILRLDLGGSSVLPTGFHRLDGPGGVSLGSSATTSGDGRSAATSNGSGGGVVAVGVNRSDLD